MDEEVVTLENPIEDTIFDHFSEERLARGLGWIGLGLGALALTRPAAIAAMLGVPGSSAVVAAVGAREIASGLGILGRRQPTGWLWARVAGDVMSLAVIGAAARRSSQPRSAALAAVAVVTALDILCARRLARASRDDGHALPRDRSIRVDRTETVSRPREECYRFWRDLENLPRFMAHIASVESIDETHSRWIANGPASIPIEWDAEIINDVPNERIAWRSYRGSTVASAGTVRFENADGGGTRIHVKMNYRLPGGTVGAALAKLLGEDPETKVEEDLERFKRALEA